MLLVVQIFAQRTSQLLVLLAAGCLTTMTGSLVSPVLPEMVQQLELDPGWAGTLVSMHALTIALFTPLAGIIADRIGKVKVLVTALFSYAIFGTAGAFMVSLAPLLVSRGLLGVASGSISAAAIGLLSNIYQGEARARLFGYATSAMTTVSIFAPLLGGWVGSINWQFTFYLYAMGLPVAIAAAIILRKEDFSTTSTTSTISTQLGKELVTILKKSQIIKLFLTLALAAIIVYAVVIYTPLYLKAAIGAGPQLNGVVLAFRAVGVVFISALVASRIANILGTYQTIALGFVLMSLTLLTIPFLVQIHWILPTAFLFGAGFGVVVPNVYDALAKLAPEQTRATVLAIGTGSNSLGQFLSPILLGPVWKYTGITNVFYVAAGIAMVIGCLMLLPTKDFQDAS